MAETLVAMQHADVAGIALLPVASQAYWESLGWTVVAGAPPGPSVSDQQLIEWTLSEAYRLSSITYHATYTASISQANVTWPDGSTGVLNVSSFDATSGRPKAFTITHTGAGRTVNQAAMTFDGSGRVTTQPALSVS